MKLIAIWHTGVQSATDFANLHGIGGNCVAMVPEMSPPQSLWGFYSVDRETYKELVKIPRLTYK